ncbi:MAG: aminotransferase class IV [Bacteroidia bacterium]|nr:aminotransferase class IV [Bacteroidia bacterium]MBT8310153.1 aminotransferase class IV [Bacteroidia bacterium]NND09583.1 aminotransferase class IV [Flavobacteriaceae bacterium]NNK27197.1 aminotransferase class IV [Flavobacteriaceae bacterium]NNL60905.1 aminotransferase class IV [Flavobacteriaceae bacterium]
MVNINGEIIPSEQASISIANRGLNYGDALFETIKFYTGKLLFWEDHYFRLMASMRILRMEIPMNFTMEFLEEEIIRTINSNNLERSSFRIKLFVYRKSNGLYRPEVNDVGYYILVDKTSSDFYTIKEDDQVIDIFRDHYVLSGLLSNLKTNNRVINVVGSIYANENNLHNCLLLNEKKEVVEALNGNIFLVNGNSIKTPPLSSGCIKGIMRKQIIDVLKAVSDYEFIEDKISPFELQKADELWITNVLAGIVPIYQYRKKTYEKKVALDILGKINAKIRLG